MKKNILVGQSGGPTAVINASLCGTIVQGLAHPDEVETIYGMINGIEGFLENRITDLSFLSSRELELLKLTPAAYLGSCRCKLPEDLTDPVYDLLFQKLDSLNIGAFFYIGGNDSMDTVDKLSRCAAMKNSSITFMGIPKTIDNDLPVTDHTPGYGSAARYVASTVREICLDASVYQQPAVTIIELMGRHAGWVTAASALARKFKGDNPLLIYMPEVAFDMEQFFSEAEAALKKNPTLVICVSEGIKDASGKLICEYGSEAKLDNFGHKMLTGCGKLLENQLKNRFGIKVRSVELNVSQRCSSIMASETDINEAAALGSFAVEKALSGSTGQMAALLRKPSLSYETEYFLTPVETVCNKEKTFPLEWITRNGTDIGTEFTDYALPLIQGTPNRPMENGLPLYLYRKSER